MTRPVLPASSSLPDSSSLGFPTECRLKKTAEFQRVYDLKQRAGDAHLLIFGAPNELSWSRIGLSVSRKNGSAVRRNRIKRLLREAFRLSRQRLPQGYDWVLIPRVDSGATLLDYQKSLKHLTQKLARRHPGRSDQ